MKILSRIFYGAAVIAAFCSCNRDYRPADGEHTLRVLTTNDTHGSWFDSTYVGTETRTSLFAAKVKIDSVRSAAGADNVLLIDAGDCLQGNNAAYYYNYVDTLTPHLLPRLLKYMGYDAVAVGNHDIETGHGVYDRVKKELDRAGIAFLAGNAVRTDNGKPYFGDYAVFEKAGLKVLVLGYTNANIKGWLNESLWYGMDFKSLLPLVQEDVDRINAREKAQVVIVAVHSGSGEGDGMQLENQALDLLESLRGVDFVIAAHDHRALTADKDGISMINSGSHARKVGYGEITVNVKDGQVVSKKISTSLIDVDRNVTDEVMKSEFRKDYEAVKSFTLKEAGELGVDLVTRDAYKGMCPYLNLIHTVGLQYADISIAAPLTFDGIVRKGTLVFNDLFTIYPFENQLFTLELTGKEIKDYLEYSYEGWINTVSDIREAAEGRSSEHVLKIKPQDDQRYGLDKWSFVGRSYNFDSAAGICYTVDVTKEYGDRVVISSMADGSGFDMDRTYRVAMTSYRASGGGNILREGAGVSDPENRIVEKRQEYREIIYGYLQKHGRIDPEVIGDESVIGRWSFVPEKEASLAIARDLSLIF